MLKVLETFSGIGAQAKALDRLDIEYEIIATADWDINAIIAYDLIHNGKQNLDEYKSLSKEDVLSELKKYTLSYDGKTVYEYEKLKKNNISVLKSLLYAIKRSKNLTSITDVTSKNIPNDLDLLTYSFPCQDLSIAGLWHGNVSGIDRDANNRSGMLWEIERIIKECVCEKKHLPNFLLMENVSNILSKRHISNFNEWQDYLKDIGYYNKVYKLNAKDFGIPQNRERVYMLSILTESDKEINRYLDEYFFKNTLENDLYIESLNLKRISMEDIIKNNYDNPKYKKEANQSQLNNTPSRIKIVNENEKIFTDGIYSKEIKTITTKQDRNPNSGVVEYKNNVDGKLNWRYLTPRECFVAMGFDESDYDILLDNNIKINESRKFFSNSKLIKMAGNSIAVNVLQAIFYQIIEIKKIIKNK